MRQDIQSLRGISILFVILYHMFPTVFPNGFLGVDIFFVISGYLMCKNLTKKEIMCVPDILKFYYRRLKRILPLYYLVCLFIIISIHFFICDVWWENNYRYSLASLFLVTNQLIIHDSGNYFREFLADKTSLNAFIHFWSLGVEIQFYFLVPFIFIALQLLKSNMLKLITSILITAIGFTVFIFINQHFAFNFMLLRLWQFSAGFIPLFFSKLNLYELSIHLKPGNVRKWIPIPSYDAVNIALAVLMFCILPQKIDELFLRPIITLSAAYLLLNEFKENKFLNSSFLIYIGDLSYVLYLVHWPIIVIFGGQTITSILFCTVSILIISIILHHSYEQIYLKLNAKAITPLLIFLIICNAYIQQSIRRDDIWKHVYSEELQNLVDNNMGFLPTEWEIHPPADNCTDDALEDPEYNEKIVFGYCLYPRGNGTLNILIIGNSYVLNTAESIRSHFNYNYSTFEYASLGESYGLYEDTPTSILSLGISKRLVARRKPDVLFIIARYSPTPKSYFYDEESDAYVAEFNRNINFYEKYTKQIFILGAHPLYSLNFLNFFIHYATQKPDEVHNLHLEKSKADNEMKYIRKRFQHLKCTKCQIFEIGHVFLKNDKYLTFDPDTMLSYVDNTIHLTSPALKLVNPIFANLTRTILNKS